MSGGWLAGGMLALFTLAAVPTARGEEVRPIGPEFQVSGGHHSYYAFYDGYASNVGVSRAPSGDFVVVWEDVAGHYGQGDTNYAYRVSAKRFHRDGGGAGQQITVAQHTKKYVRQFKPDIAATTNDGFVVVWGYSYDDGYFNARFGRVWAKRFDANSNALGPEVQVNTTEAYVNDYTGWNGVAAAPDGGFLVVWVPAEAADVNARRFDASGNPVTPEFAVNDAPVVWGQPAVGSNADGDFVVSWGNYNSCCGPVGTFAQRIDSNGNQIGSDIHVDDHGESWKNSVAVAPDGGFVVTSWVGPYGDPAQDLTARIYDPSGAPVTPEFDIDGEADLFGVNADPDGNFVFVWRDDQWNVKGRRLSPTGAPLGDVFQVSDLPQYGGGGYELDHFPEVATDAAGDFVVVWSNNNYGYYGAGGSYVNWMGAWARRFAVCGNGRVGPDDACDDGNTTALDGCSATCRVETCHTCAGDPSVCPTIPGCTSVCTDPAPIPANTALLTFKGLGAPVGDEGVVFKGKITNPPLAHLEYDPSVEGAEVALTTSDAVWVLAGATRVPPGLVGTGCASTDGWKVRPGTYVYKNASNALPPGCAPGSADGLRVLKLKDKLDRDGTIQFRVKARNATIGVMPAPPLVATVVLGQSPGAGAAGRCGQITFTGAIGGHFYP